MVKHTQIQLFDSAHSYWCAQAPLGLPEVILNLNLQHANTELSYDTSRHLPTQS